MGGVYYLWDHCKLTYSHCLNENFEPFSSSCAPAFYPQRLNPKKRVVRFELTISEQTIIPKTTRLCALPIKLHPRLVNYQICRMVSGHSGSSCRRTFYRASRNSRLYMLRIHTDMIRCRTHKSIGSRRQKLKKEKICES